MFKKKIKNTMPEPGIAYIDITPFAANSNLMTRVGDEVSCTPIRLSFSSEMIQDLMFAIEKLELNEIHFCGGGIVGKQYYEFIKKDFCHYSNSKVQFKYDK